MLLREIFAELPVSRFADTALSFDFDQDVTGISEDLRTLHRGELFCAVRGETFDGHSVLRKAAEAGASAALIDNPAFASVCADCGLPWICTDSVRACLLPLYLAWHHHPERGMTFYAVTGTNGKTSVSYLLSSILSRAGKTCAVLGTVENRIGGRSLPSDMTTPAPAVLASLLKEAEQEHTDTIILEASSHALAQNRLSGLTFACGIFTNLTEDHLDYHKTEEAYFQAKRSLFFSCQQCLFCTDTAAGIRLYHDPAFHGRAFCCAVDRGADFSVCETILSETGSRFRICCQGRSFAAKTRLIGSFAAANALAAASCALLSGIGAQEIAAGLADCTVIPGRLERIVSAPFSVYLDYAHTPDALKKALESLRPFVKTGASLRVLFGCGGDREKEKRPKMGRIAAEYADDILLTQDNSRTEDCHAILSEIAEGIPGGTACTVIPDRKEAIETLLSLAHPGDVLLLAGKGHETYMVSGTEKTPFSERAVVHAWMRAHLTHE